MANQGNREIVGRFIDALTGQHTEALRPLVARDAVFDWPQTGERIRGLENMLEIDRNYPGGLPDAKARRIIGTEDRWIVDATFTPRRISGSGDVWVAEADLRYPDGSTWAYCNVIELRDGLVLHTTEYWAPRSEAPGWRSAWTEALVEE